MPYNSRAIQLLIARHNAVARAVPSDELREDRKRPSQNSPCSVKNAVADGPE
jgi:hypothetical protein